MLQFPVPHLACHGDHVRCHDVAGARVNARRCDGWHPRIRRPVVKRQKQQFRPTAACERPAPHRHLRRRNLSQHQPHSMPVPQPPQPGRHSAQGASAARQPRTSGAGPWRAASSPRRRTRPCRAPPPRCTPPAHCTRCAAGRAPPHGSPGPRPAAAGQLRLPACGTGSIIISRLHAPRHSERLKPAPHSA